MKLGYHVSISGGINKAIDRGQELGCEAIQIFISSPRSWNFDIPSKKEIDLFKKKWKKSDIKNIVSHSSYLVNLASKNSYIYTNTINSILSGLEASNRLGLLGLVTHIGSHKGEGITAGVEKASTAINTILDTYKGDSFLILEISSGAGDLLGKNFDELKLILDKVREKGRVGVCLDTAHAFASGYNIKTKEGLKKLVENIDQNIGLEKLKVLHLNDSKSDLGSNKDRHENIGTGYLGLNAFKNIVNHPKLKHLPGILETTDILSEYNGKTNLEILRTLEK